MMKVVFFGTPEVAVPYLELLAQAHEVVAVVSQPDKPAGRSLKVEPTPVKRKALELGLAVLQPRSPSEIAGRLKELSPELGVAVAYGRILKPDVLSLPKLGILNVHFSLLPKYRGAAPVQWSLVRGETASGVTVFWLDEGMDTGPIFTTRRTEIGPDEDAGELLARLQGLGLEALSEALLSAAAGKVERRPQQGEPSLAPLIKKEDARLSLDRCAQEAHDLVRGFRIWPRAYVQLKSGRLLVLKTRLEPGRFEGKPGQVVAVERTGGILVQCGLNSRLWFLSVQPEGNKPVNAADFLNGLRLTAGDFLPFAENGHGTDA